MPGRTFLTASMFDLAATLNVSVDPVADEPSRKNIAPGQQIVVLTCSGLTRMRWGIIPVGRKNARGRPVMETIVNARSETVLDKSAFQGVGRAVVPANGWYEWTGSARKKTAWAISPKDEEFLFFAAISDIWTAPGGLQVPQVATVTCAPNDDVEPIHHRMGVLLSLAEIPTWLEGEEAEIRALMKPWPNGRLNISQVRDVDWSAP